MKEIEELLENEAGNLKEQVDQLADDYLNRFRGYFNDSSSEVQDKVKQRLRTASELRYAAFKAKTTQDRDELINASETALMRAKTILYAEAVVKSEETANLIADGFKAVLDTFALTASTVIRGTVKGVVGGTVEGIGLKML